MNKLSFNILGQQVADIPRLLNRLEKRQPAWALVLDNLDLARQIKARVLACNVIFRTWPDDGLHTSREAEAWILEKKAQLQGADLWVYCGNEPGWSAFALRQTASALKVSAQRVQAFAVPSPLAFIREFFLWVFWRLFMRVESQAVKSSVQWAIDIILAAKKHGLKVVVLNLSSGTPSPDDWKADKAQQLLRLLGTNRDMAVLGLHEYACGVITSGVDGGWPSFIRAEDWPVSVEGRTCWHLGRYRFMVQACEQSGIRVPRVVITEFGFDDMSDIKQWSEMLVKTSPHQTIRGWKTLVNQWREWWKTWTPQYALFRSYAYAVPVFYSHPAVEGVLTFQYGARSVDWNPFDVEAADEFHTLLEDEPGEEPTMPVPAGNTYQLVKLTGANFVNLRAEPKAKADDKGDLKTGDVLYIYPDTPVSTDGYTWVKVDQWRSNAKLVTGVWLAVTLAAVGLTVTSAPTLPEEPDPVEQATTDTLKLIDHLTLALNVVAQSMAAELGQAVVELNRIRDTLKG